MKRILAHIATLCPYIFIFGLWIGCLYSMITTWSMFLSVIIGLVAIGFFVAILLFIQEKGEKWLDEHRRDK